MVSVVVALVGGAAFYVESRAGDDTLGWLMAGLAALMIGAVWLFPEARRIDKRD
jgi:hypothetical protein